MITEQHLQRDNHIVASRVFFICPIWREIWNNILDWTTDHTLDRVQHQTKCSSPSKYCWKILSHILYAHPGIQSGGFSEGFLSNFKILAIHSYLGWLVQCLAGLPVDVSRPEILEFHKHSLAIKNNNNSRSYLVKGSLLSYLKQNRTLPFEYNLVQLSSW